MLSKFQKIDHIFIFYFSRIFSYFTVLIEIIRLLKKFSKFCEIFLYCILYLMILVKVNFDEKIEKQKTTN